MSLWETFTDNFIGPIITKLICMPYYRPWFEDLRNVKAFNLERARNVRIPILNDGSSTDLVIFALLIFHDQRSIVYRLSNYTIRLSVYNKKSKIVFS